jgi:uncharacterized protein (TIGR03067 family)
VLTCHIGGQPVSCAVDTGGQNYLYVHQKTADRLGLTAASRGQIGTAGGPTNVQFGWVQHFVIGAFRTDGGAMVSVPTVGGLPLGAGAAGGEPPDVVLGFAALDRYDAIIDIPNATLYLRPPGTADLPKLAGHWSCREIHNDGLPASPLEVQRTSVRIAGEKMSLTADRGGGEFTLWIDDRRRPKRMYPWEVDPSTGGRYGSPCAYELAGDVLTVNMPTAATPSGWPTDLRPGPSRRVYTFDRVKPPMIVVPSVSPEP